MAQSQSSVATAKYELPDLQVRTLRPEQCWDQTCCSMPSPRSVDRVPYAHAHLIHVALLQPCGHILSRLHVHDAARRAHNVPLNGLAPTQRNR